MNYLFIIIITASVIIWLSAYVFIFEPIDAKTREYDMQIVENVLNMTEKDCDKLLLGQAMLSGGFERSAEKIIEMKIKEFGC